MFSFVWLRTTATLPLTLLLAGLALFGGLSVFLLNGTSLFYFDTLGYLDTGDKLLGAIFPLGPVGSEVTSPGAGAASAPAAPSGTMTIGSRSVLYALLLTAAQRLGWLDAMVLVNLAAIWSMLWLLARTAARAWGLAASPALISATLILAGCLGSLPFYTAFLMPDILAPVLILALAALTAFGSQMRAAEAAFAIGLILLAVLSHLSHLVIAALLAPLALLMAPPARSYRYKILLLTAMLAVGLGIAERLVFNRAAEVFQGKEVVYLPFLTARLIDDGPGFSYLAEVCPQAGLATCALYRTLIRDGREPLRRDAPMIIFSHDPGLGSYQLLTIPERRQISREQLGFAVNVTVRHPLPVLMSVARNAVRQLSLPGIGMTIPGSQLIANAAAPDGKLGPHYATGRLFGTDRAWIAPLGFVHGVFYAVSALGIAVLLAWPGAVPQGGKHLAAMVLAGIVVNALVCGSISEPAERYGARVLFLLPILAVLLVWPLLGRRKEPIA